MQVLSTFAGDIPGSWFLEELHLAFRKFRRDPGTLLIEQGSAEHLALITLYSYWIRRVPSGDALLEKYGEEILEYMALQGRHVASNPNLGSSLSECVTFLSVFLVKLPKVSDSALQSLLFLTESSSFDSE